MPTQCFALALEGLVGGDVLALRGHGGTDQNDGRRADAEPAASVAGTPIAARGDGVGKHEEGGVPAAFFLKALEPFVER